jgi:hypothetical protein
MASLKTCNNCGLQYVLFVEYADDQIYQNFCSYKCASDDYYYQANLENERILKENELNKDKNNQK